MSTLGDCIARGVNIMHCGCVSAVLLFRFGRLPISGLISRRLPNIVNQYVTIIVSCLDIPTNNTLKPR